MADAVITNRYSVHPDGVHVTYECVTLFAFLRLCVIRQTVAEMGLGGI